MLCQKGSAQENAFQRATGKGVRIAVLDTGANPAHPHLHAVAGGISIGLEDPLKTYVDFVGHGTAVMAAIQEKAPDAEYYAVKIYYKSLRTNVALLIEGIEWAIDQRVDVINMSLGTCNQIHRDALARVLQRALDSGIIAVAPVVAGDQDILPGNLEGIIGVEIDPTCPRDRFRHRADMRPCWAASGYPRTLPGVDPEKNLKGTSFAVANMSGFVAKACELLKGGAREPIQVILQSEAEHL